VSGRAPDDLDLVIEPMRPADQVARPASITGSTHSRNVPNSTGAVFGSRSALWK
jgi:hypothetical protein